MYVYNLRECYIEIKQDMVLTLFNFPLYFRINFGPQLLFVFLFLLKWWWLSTKWCCNEIERKGGSLSVSVKNTKKNFINVYNEINILLCLNICRIFFQIKFKIDLSQSIRKIIRITFTAFGKSYVTECCKIAETESFSISKD